MPTKDEVALVDDRALTIQDYYMIRSKLQTPSSDHALWVGISMLALQNKTRFDGKEISIQAAFDIARYAIRDLPPSYAAASLREYYKQTPSLPEPEEVKKEMEALSQKSIVRRNPVPLSQFN